MLSLPTCDCDNPYFIFVSQRVCINGSLRPFCDCFYSSFQSWQQPFWSRGGLLWLQQLTGEQQLTQVSTITAIAPPLIVVRWKKVLQARSVCSKEGLCTDYRCQNPTTVDNCRTVVSNKILWSSGSVSGLGVTGEHTCYSQQNTFLLLHLSKPATLHDCTCKVNSCFITFFNLNLDLFNFLKSIWPIPFLVNLLLVKEILAITYC